MAAHQKKRQCLFFKGTIAHLTRGRAIKTLIVASAERLKILFVLADFPRAQFIRTFFIPNEDNNAIILPTIRGERAIHRIRFSLFQSCLQFNVSSCKRGEFRDG